MPETSRHESGSFCWIELGTLEGIGRTAVFADPQGAAFAVIWLKR